MRREANKGVLRDTGRVSRGADCPHCGGCGYAPRRSPHWTIEWRYQDCTEYSDRPDLKTQADVQRYLRGLSLTSVMVSAIAPDGRVYTFSEAEATP